MSWNPYPQIKKFLENADPFYLHSSPSEILEEGDFISKEDFKKLVKKRILYKNGLDIKAMLPGVTEDIMYHLITSKNDFDLSGYKSMDLELKGYNLFSREHFILWQKNPMPDASEGGKIHFFDEYRRKEKEFREKYGLIAYQAKNDLDTFVRRVYLENTSLKTTYETVVKNLRDWIHQERKRIQKEYYKMPRKQRPSLDIFHKKVQLILESYRQQLEFLEKEIIGNSSLKNPLIIPFATWFQVISKIHPLGSHRLYMYGDLVIYSPTEWAFKGYRNMYDYWNAEMHLNSEGDKDVDKRNEITKALAAFIHDMTDNPHWFHVRFKQDQPYFFHSLPKRYSEKDILLMGGYHH